jgi:hypothetical protein
MSEYVVIRIRKKDGHVSITDEEGNKVEGKPVDPGEPLKIGHQVAYCDQATWYSTNPICVWHGGRLYCG